MAFHTWYICRIQYENVSRTGLRNLCNNPPKVLISHLSPVLSCSMLDSSPSFPVCSIQSKLLRVLQGLSNWKKYKQEAVQSKVKCKSQYSSFNFRSRWISQAWWRTGGKTTTSVHCNLLSTVQSAYSIKSGAIQCLNTPVQAAPP